MIVKNVKGIKIKSDGSEFNIFCKRLSKIKDLIRKKDNILKEFDLKYYPSNIEVED